MALELAVFDIIPKDKAPSFVRGFTAALIATSACYPLDTVRRHIQLQTGPRIGVLATMLGMWLVVWRGIVVWWLCVMGVCGPCAHCDVHLCRACMHGWMQTGFTTSTTAIAQKDGVMALYRGFLPNALKNLPNKGMQQGGVVDMTGAPHTARTTPDPTPCRHSLVHV